MSFLKSSASFGCLMNHTSGLWNQDILAKSTLAKWLSSSFPTKFKGSSTSFTHFPNEKTYQWEFLCFKIMGLRCSSMVQVLKFLRKLRLPKLRCWAFLIPLKSKLLRYASKQWNVEGSSGSSWRWWRKQRRWWMWWTWRWWGWDWGEHGRSFKTGVMWRVRGFFSRRVMYCIFCDKSVVW